MSSNGLAITSTDARRRVHLVGTHVAVHVDEEGIAVVSVDVVRCLLEQLAVREREEANEGDGGKVGHMAHRHGKIHVKQVRPTGIPLVVWMESDIDRWRADTIRSRGKRGKAFGLRIDSKRMGYGSSVSTHDNTHHRLVFNRFQDHTL